MRYLLNELHTYETDFSNTLGLTSREATASFAGEVALLCPASTEEFRMAHVALMVNVATLQKAVMTIGESQAAMSEDMRQQFNDVTNLINNALAPSLGALASTQDTNSECTTSTHTAPSNNG